MSNTNIFKKRYAIVRVDKLKFCPSDIEGIDDKLVCSKTKDGESKVCVCRYGDTKEQLIRKVAQVRYRQELKLWWKLFKQEGIKLEATYERCLREAKEIVEFLGVEE